MPDIPLWWMISVVDPCLHVFFVYFSNDMDVFLRTLFADVSGFAGTFLGRMFTTRKEGVTVRLQRSLERSE